MKTSTIEKRKYTFEDYLKTPEDKRYELIEGELIMTPSPVPYHQWISKNIGYELEKFVREKNLGKVFYAPCDVYLDNENVIQPDILFISKERLDIIGEKNIQAAPDLVIEILSETSAYRDLVKKKRLYAQFGVKEYWIVDPEEKTAEIYSLKDNTFILTKSFTEKDSLESPLLSAIEIKLAQVFEF
ncbi:MAG: Uma2 family endonuclease [Nitrospirota bacterium]